MRITFLGTGTSQGVPVINCNCPVCRSGNPKNKRMRCSVMIQTGGQNILIDTSPDMRQQFLSYPFERIDAILYTHAHADHIFGLDELRRFNYIQKQVIPVFGNAFTIDRIKRIFGYAFNDGNIIPGIPNVQANIIEETFTVNGIIITPIPLQHGEDIVFGYRIGDFAYCTDVSRIPKESYPILQNLKVLVIGALREKKHSKHFSLNEAIAEAEKNQSKKTYFTHISHMLDQDIHGANLPADCLFAYDGLSIEI